MDRRIQHTIALLKDDLRLNISPDKLARSVNLSLSRFQHLFKAETGTSPAHYIRALRIAQARALLETSLLNVKQIVNRVGLRDKSHFERAFKQAHGLTPTQYRAAHSLIGVAKTPVHDK